MAEAVREKPKRKKTKENSGRTKDVILNEATPDSLSDNNTVKTSPSINISAKSNFSNETSENGHAVVLPNHADFEIVSKCTTLPDVCALPSSVVIESKNHQGQDSDSLEIRIPCGTVNCGLNGNVNDGSNVSPVLHKDDAADRSVTKPQVESCHALADYSVVTFLSDSKESVLTYSGEHASEKETFLYGNKEIYQSNRIRSDQARNLIPDGIAIHNTEVQRDTSWEGSLEQEVRPMYFSGMSTVYGDVEQQGASLQDASLSPAKAVHGQTCHRHSMISEDASPKLLPFTDEQLLNFYFNPELLQLDSFVDQFIQNSSREDHVFFELVEAYQRSRNALVTIQSSIQALKVKCDEERLSVWSISQSSVQAEGICRDHVKVWQLHQYETATYDDAGSAKLNSTLSDMRQLVHETYQLQAYNSEAAKIRVDDYLFNLFDESVLKNASVASYPISALLPRDLHMDTLPVLCELQDCISVLFTFKRQGVLEDQFLKDVDEWLEKLVSALLRIGTLPDSFFLLNHLLRCPPGMAGAMAHFIQFPTFDAHHSLPVFERPQVHHFVVMLASLTLPIRSRKEFLTKFEQKMRQNALDRSISWLLIDEDKEEDENPADSWCLLYENDLIAIFEQFPFDELFTCLFSINRINEMPVHSASLVSSGDMMRLFAFSSSLVNLLGKIFETYNLLRYRQFVKRVSRTIRLVVQVVSDHWASYRLHRLNVSEEAQTDYAMMMTASYNGMLTMDRLQLEFDQFFLRSVRQILFSHMAGAVQFLSAMPFEAVSLKSLWTVLVMILNDNPDVLENSGPEDLPSVAYLDVSPSEAVFLLTALCNMAVARPPEDQILIETVSKQILEISFLNPAVMELYTKHGRDLLFSIIRTHPFVVSALLEHVDSMRNPLRQNLIYIFKGMPLCEWLPTPSDLELIRTWLMRYPVTSEESQLARLLLLSLNYGVKSTGVTGLHIQRCYHYTIAILIVEVFGLHFPDYPGGFENLSYADLGFIGQVGKIAVASYNKLLYSQIHSEFLAWGWDVLLSLKLHANDATGVESATASHSLSEASSSGTSKEIDDGTWSGRILPALAKMSAPDFELDHTPELLNVRRAVQAKGFFACYVALSMTKHGHFVDLFLKKGMDLLMVLHDACQYDAVLRVVSNVVPLFFDCPERLAGKDFLKVINSLIHVDVDRAGYTEKLWQYYVVGTYSHKLAAMVTSLIHSTKSRDGAAQLGIRLWMTLMKEIQNWHRDHSVLYQVDNICKVAFAVASGLEVIKEIIYSEFENFIKAQEPRGLLSSVMSWMQSSPFISIMPAPTPNFCYFAYVVLSVEQMYEERTGLWNEITTDMLMHERHGVDHAYKKACSKLKLYMPPLANLCIYRWADQAMVTPMDHPFLPLMWQQFFLLFLVKPKIDSGLQSRSGIGFRFFSDFNYNSLAKRMRGVLYSISGHHQNKSVAKDADSQASDAKTWTFTEKEHTYSEETHQELARLYQGLALWMEEPRLHDPNLYISALPEAYNPRLLEKVFQGDRSLWLDYVDYSTMQAELESLGNLWSHSIVKPAVRQPSLQRGEESPAPPLSAGQRILSRLGKENRPRPPPEFSIQTSPVPVISVHMILKRPRLIQDVSEDLERVVQYAKKSSDNLSKHVGLDANFMELLPDLYELVPRKVMLMLPCEGRRKGRSSNMCSGPAQVKVEFTELNLRERVSRCLDDNRAETRRLIESCTQSAPRDLCIGAVHIENVISKLAAEYPSLSATHQGDLRNGGKRLFYLLTELIDHDVKRCNPAIQFFSSCIDTLGKKFIADDPDEQVTLLDTILARDPSVVYLAPHFFPQKAFCAYVQLYSKIVANIGEPKATTIFVLLSKFDIHQWLDACPPLAECKALVSIVMIALNSIGASPGENLAVVLELVRGHMIALLGWSFPDLYCDVLQSLMQSSAKRSMHAAVWDDFVFCIGYNPQVSTLRNKQSRTLPDREVKETIQYLAVFFEALVKAEAYSLGAVYEKWDLYCRPLSRFIVGLFRQLVDQQAAIHSASVSKEPLVQDLWKTVLLVHEPWLIPNQPSKLWTVQRTESVLALVQSFTEVIRYIINVVVSNNGYCSLLNMVWGYYFQSVVPRVREENSLEIFHSLLATLPWNMFCPSIHDLGFILQSFSTCPAAFKFFGLLLAEIDWASVVSVYSNSGNIQVVERLHGQLLSIFVMMASHKEILDSSASKLRKLFHIALDFPWDMVNLDDVQTACRWYAENSDSAGVLDSQSFTWCTLQLLAKVCGHDPASTAHRAEPVMVQKRNVYVQTIVTLLTRCSSLKNRAAEFAVVVNRLLSTVEATMAYNSGSVMQELVVHCSTCLGLLNNIPDGSAIFEAVRKSMDCHLAETNCGLLVLAFMSASSRSLASIQHMVMLLETAIGSHFTRLSDGDLKTAWVQVLQAFVVPDLCKEEFVKEAIHQKALLTMYSYNLKRIPSAKGQSEQLAILVETVQWCSQVQLDQESEPKMLLLWLQIFDIVRQQIPQYQFSHQFQQLAKYMLFLAHACQQLAEDKTYSGVLGVIGIGKKSPLSKSFRFSAKAVHMFLLAQMPSSLNAIRASAGAPGAIRGGDRRSLPTSEAEKTYTNFVALARNKSYSHLKEQLDWIVSFISEPSTCVADGCGLVAYLCREFFAKENYISASLS